MPNALAAGIGWSENAEGAAAGKEAAERALKRLSPHKPKAAIVFGSSWLEQSSLLQGVSSVVKKIPVVGESTAGEIVPLGPVNHRCVVVLLAAEELFCSIGVGEGVDAHPRESGQRAAYMALQHFKGSGRTGFLLFGDGLSTHYADAIRGAQESLGTSFPIVGGLAGDDLRFVQTYQYCNARAMSRSVVGLLLGGAIKLGVGMEHGFAPISKPRRITRAVDNVLYELDQRPAATVYEEYLGPELFQRMRQEGVRQAIAYPLGIQPEDSTQWLLRNVISFGTDGSLSCSGEILQGSWLQLMIGNRELALEASQKAARDAIRRLHQVGCVLVFNSAVRRRILGSQYAAMEIARIREIVGMATPVVGCYTYGEEAPVSGLGDDRIVVQTNSVLVVALGT